MINTLGIKGYKSIKEVQIDLKPINIFIGANGSGKSNFISFFEFLDNLYNKKLQEYVGLRGGIEKFLHKGSHPATGIEGYLKFDDGTNSYSFQLQPDAETFVVSTETLWYHDNPLEYRAYTKEAQIKNNTWHRGNYIQKHLTGYKKYHFHETGKNSPFNSTMQIGKDSLVLYDKGENLAPVLYKIKHEHPKIYSRIVKTIQSIAPYFSDFVLEPNEAGYMKLYWQDKFSAYNYGVVDLSDGTIRFIAMAVLFMQPYPPETIVVDEPELGLHPFAISKLAGMISSAAGRGSQVIVATQSVELVNCFQPEDIVAVDQKEGSSIFTRLKNEDFRIWLEEYSLGDLWQMNIINKGQPFQTL